jgi:hypothetical protein
MTNEASSDADVVLAAVEREAAVRAAAQAEAAERQTREMRERDRDDALAVEMVSLSLAQLADIANGPDVHRAEAAVREGEHRQAIRMANQAALAAREAEVQARDASPLPIVAPKPVAPTPLTGGGARVSARRRWTYEMCDPDDLTRVPDAYKQLDSVAVRAAIRAGVRSIPGLRIYQEDEASVTL